MMIKENILKLIHSLGYHLTKVNSSQKTVYSTELQFYKTKTGNYYLPIKSTQDLVIQAIISNNIFDEQIVNLASKYIKNGSVVLDIGSNFGQMAVLFSNMVGEFGKVYAFEADDFIFSVLEKNINANNKKNVIANFGAVHHQLNETLYFPLQDFKRFGSYGSYGIDYKNKKGRPVKALTIDSLDISEPISFIKIDIQGGDLFALQGAKNTILKNKMPIVFEYEYLFEGEMNFNFQQYVDFVHEINYKFERVINGHNFLIVPK